MKSARNQTIKQAATCKDGVENWMGEGKDLNTFGALPRRRGKLKIATKYTAASPKGPI